MERLNGVELFQQGVSVDFVKALFDVCIQDILGLEAGVIEDGFYRIVGTASWAETIRVRLKVWRGLFQSDPIVAPTPYALVLALLCLA